MRTIAHISDLHFGREDPIVARALLRDLEEEPPDLLAVSGDITQRARRRQFEAARGFLAAIRAPRIVVPGNHDLPLFDLFSRLLRPLAGYRRHLGEETDPFFADAELAVAGLNTARAASYKNGRLGLGQIAALRERFRGVPSTAFKVVVTHHPFLPAPGDHEPVTVGRGLLALEAAESCGVDLFLAGHLHRGFTADVRTHHVSVQRSMLVAQAGTAISTRTRREPNSYNRLRLEPGRLTIETRGFDGTRFVPLAAAHYRKNDAEWERR